MHRFDIGFCLFLRIVESLDRVSFIQGDKPAKSTGRGNTATLFDKVGGVGIVVWWNPHFEIDC